MHHLETDTKSYKNLDTMDKHIQKALRHIQNAEYAGYFAEIGKVTPESHKPILKQLEGRFIAGQAPWDFYQQLDRFARQIQEAIQEENLSTSETNTTMSSNTPEAFVQEMKKQLEDEYQIIADATFRRNISRNPEKRMEYEGFINQGENNIQFIEKRFLQKATQEYQISTNDAQRIIQELKQEIQQQFQQQDANIEQKLEEFIQHIDESHQALVTNIVDQIAAENADLLHKMQQSLENKEVTTLEVNQWLTDVRNNLPVHLPQKDKVQKVLDSMDVTAASKLKITIPIIPVFLQYEKEIGLQWAQNIPKRWKSWVQKMRERITHG
ncbi:hypothetical protein BKI52_18825 [marine bacterium AO1-C]|nr:hypothetical protein BKI52_18825 [marine bacterium AO1-C]